MLFHGCSLVCVLLSAYATVQYRSPGNLDVTHSLECQLSVHRCRPHRNPHWTQWWTEPTSTQLLCNETGPFPDSPPPREYCGWHTATSVLVVFWQLPSHKFKNMSTNKMFSLYSLPLFCELLGLLLLALLSFGAHWDSNEREPHCSVSFSVRVCGPPGFLILHY